MIVTLAEIKEYLKIDPADMTYDDFLNNCNEIVQDWVENYCQRKFEIVRIDNELTSGEGTRFLRVKNIPIHRIISIEYTYDYVNWNPYTWSISTDGLVIYGYYPFIKGFLNHRVSYEAGSPDIPAGLKKTIIEMVAEMFLEGPGQGRLGTRSTSGGVNKTYESLFERFKSQLDIYKIDRML